jgi:hypothetical protein
MFSRDPKGSAELIYSFPRSAWERTFPTLRVGEVLTSVEFYTHIRDAERPKIAFPRGAWERVG